MKVLRVLGLIFGILLLLAGGIMLAASFAIGQGSSEVQKGLDRGLTQSGLSGPVDGTVVSIDGSRYTVTFTTENGEEYTTQAEATLTTPAQVGDTVPVYYQTDQPSVAIVTDAFDTALGTAANTLKIAGIVCLVVGGLLLVGSILAFALGKKPPRTLPVQPYPTAGYPVAQASAGIRPQAHPQPAPIPQQPGYPVPPKPYPGQPFPGQPFPGQSFPGQSFPGQSYPGQSYPGQSYPGQSSSEQVDQTSSRATQPPVQDPSQPGYSPHPYDPQPPTGGDLPQR